MADNSNHSLWRLVMATPSGRSVMNYRDNYDRIFGSRKETPKPTAKSDAQKADSVSG